MMAGSVGYLMRLLLVEDDPMLVRPLARALEAAGHEIAGQAGSVAAALKELGDTTFDAVVLDTNLRQQSAEPVAAELRARAVPFLLVTGYDADQLEGSFFGAPCLSKPYAVEDLLAAIDRLHRDA